MMDNTQELLVAAAFYTGVGLTALWYVRKIAHPDRKLFVAWFQFVGIIAGVVIGTLSVLVFAAMSTGIEGSALGRAAAPIVVIGILIPTWRYAKAFIKSHPSGRLPRLTQNGARSGSGYGGGRD